MFVLCSERGEERGAAERMGGWELVNGSRVGSAEIDRYKVWCIHAFV